MLLLPTLRYCYRRHEMKTRLVEKSPCENSNEKITVSWGHARYGVVTPFFENIGITEPRRSFRCSRFQLYSTRLSVGPRCPKGRPTRTPGTHIRGDPGVQTRGGERDREVAVKSESVGTLPCLLLCRCRGGARQPASMAMVEVPTPVALLGGLLAMALSAHYMTARSKTG